VLPYQNLHQHFGLDSNYKLVIVRVNVLFNQYLDKCITDEATRFQAQEMLGYTYLAISPEKFFILTGETNTGKSTFPDIIEFIIGEI